MKSLIILLAGLLTAIAPLTGAREMEPLKKLSLTQVEKKLTDIDTELAQLAAYSLRSGAGSVGYRSDDHPDPNCPEWVQIDLPPDTEIDQIVLVPSIWRDTKTGFRADGFPLEFRILAGTDTETRTIAGFSEKDRLLPRIAPLIIPCPAITASWVRVEADVLSPRAFDGRYDLELAEILIFNGERNVALRRPVQTLSQGFREGGARKRAYLVDGFVPYLMDAARGEQHTLPTGKVGIGDHSSLTIDLGSVLPLDRINLHAVDLGDSIPRSTTTDYGMELHLIVEGSNEADFSDSWRLAEYHINSVFDAGPIIMLNFPETPCRYVRVTGPEPYIYTMGNQRGARIGFAEIELFSRDRNVALHRPVTANFKAPLQSYAALTDGRNPYGDILPIRQWFEQLARRHDLEAERPVVAAELARRYTRQKTNLRWTGWLAALLAASVGVTVVIGHNLRMRDIALIKERFAADLHDEIGANLHTIGLLSDLAETSRDDASEQKMINQRIREVTERTGNAVRHCTDMLEAKGLYSGLPAQMHRAAQRIMAKLHHTITIEGEEFLEQLKPRIQADLFLFYKECLVNISRHSGATEFSSRLTACPEEIILTVSDNGRGMPGHTPKSLRRRAHLLGAAVSITSPPSGGSCITLRLRRKGAFLFRTNKQT
jgi:signal transduction histidine kinase